MEDLDFIKNFSKIKVSVACRFFHYDQSNLTKGKCNKEAEKNVRKYLENELSKLYQTDVDELICQK